MANNHKVLPMEQQDVAKHFNDVASRYDELYGFVYDYVTAFTIKNLQLQPDDLLADIGAGTGAITHLIWKTGDLNNPVLCVDPNPGMLQVATSKGGLKPCLATADEFFTSNSINGTRKYNKILINESAHLFPNPKGTFRNAFDYLPTNGLLVLIVRATTSTFPMWPTLKEKFAPFSEDMFKEYLVEAGFKVKVMAEVGTVEMTKGEWYNRLRKRVFSTLYEFSDEEIEEGLKELDRDWFPGKKDSDLIVISDTLQYYIATK